ncbi:transporter substrate-binding domain-containing protein [Pseudoalteromonas sp. C2R02]|uniref:substrate-binding periplasmic protein n=1 Tax=Pseudoalteromonas sp. C2R02 TaxID=2841565 RepID=UPI001C08E63F|nr:transporter substrate-binding domain-containing protein [Pseudoalteromonas sp. C2R02]MBU2968590.1 transporter substrate-binding domain-containing protein [Pseudoalteromonas sp. C2R02]
MFKNLLYIFLLSSLSISMKVHAKDKITLSVDNYPPYIDGRKNNKGKLAKIVTDIFKMQGYQVKYQFMSWPETELAITQGNSFSFMWYKTEQRTKNWIFSDPITSLNTSFLYRKNTKLKLERIDQLRRYSIGITKGYSYGDYFDDYKSQLKLVSSISDYEGIKKLLAGETDLLLIEPLVAKSLLEDWFSDEVDNTKLSYVNYLSNQPIYLVCSQQYVSCGHLMQKFNFALRELKASNTLIIE